MDLYPAIDLRGGRCVRLYQGDYGRETVYGDDPVAQARGFADAGSPWIHVVDLDAARTGEPVNRPHVAAIAAAVGVPVQTGGGVRDEAAADALLEAGRRPGRPGNGRARGSRPRPASRRARPGRGRARCPGPRRRRAGVGAGERSRRARRGPGVRGRRGGGPRRHRDRSGRHPRRPRPRGPRGGARRRGDRGDRERGVGSLDDLRTLAALEVGGRRLSGAIVGRALYEGSFTITEALEAVRVPGAPN